MRKLKEYNDWLAIVAMQAQIKGVEMPKEAELKEWFENGNSHYDVIDNIDYPDFNTNENY